MGDAREKVLPGIEAYIDQGDKGFSRIQMLLDATGGLSLSQVCAVTGLEGSTIQNWVKRGWVARAYGKRYEEEHIARILIINALKECIKLEHISLLMQYVNGPEGGEGGVIIKESELFNFLCDALGRMGKAQDHSKSGVENVINAVIRDYRGPTPDARARIRKALMLMIYACVCTDVKRGTEAMMKQIISDLENPAEPAAEAPDANVSALARERADYAESGPETRKTVSQTLREWDISSVERIIIDHSEESSGSQQSEDAEKTVNRPWFSRRK